MSTARVNDCIPFEGRPFRYQAEAAHAYYVQTSIAPSTWEWFTTTCDTNCLNVRHMRLRAPRLLAYPKHVCIYCGGPAWTKDHLLPRGWTGEARRTFVAVVPACGVCNVLLRDTLTWSITERRAICHARMRRKFRTVLRTVEYGPTDLREFGPTLRAHVVKSMSEKEDVMRWLSWPEDPTFDERALELSGIEDPYAAGILIDSTEAERIAREVA